MYRYRRWYRYWSILAWWDRYLSFRFYSLRSVHNSRYIIVVVRVQTAKHRSSHSLSSCSLGPPPSSPAVPGVLPAWRHSARCWMTSERKRSAVWCCFTAIDHNTASRDVCRKLIRDCGNTANHCSPLHGSRYAAFLSKKYRYRQYWPCIYLVSDRYQILQYRPPLPDKRTRMDGWMEICECIKYKMTMYPRIQK